LEQRDRQTIEIQREAMPKYCELHGLEVVEIYADDGISGTVPLHERPEGRRLLEDAKAGKFDTVLVYKYDRLARSLRATLDADDMLSELGVGLRSVTQPFETATASGRAMFHQLASFGEYERELIRERTQEGLHRAFSRGTHTGTLPFGYDLRRSEDGTPRYEVVEEEAAILRQLFENLAGGATLYAEAQRLNALGVPSPGWRYAGHKSRNHSSIWQPASLRRIIRNPAYGEGVHRVRLASGETIERPIPAIVTPELQRRALDRIEENRRYSGGKPHRDYLLRGLVFCEECGVAYVGSSAGSARRKVYHYYKCSRRNSGADPRTKDLRCPRVNAEWLEETVWADVRRFLENPGEVLERVREQGLGSSVDAAEVEARLERLRERLAEKRAEKAGYVRAFATAQGGITEDEFFEYTADLNLQIEHLQLLISSVEGELAAHEGERLAAASTEAWLLALRERLAEIEADTEEARRKRRELARLLVERITVGRTEDGSIQVLITYRFGSPSEGSFEEDGSHGVTNTSVANKASRGKRTNPFMFPPYLRLALEVIR
jgi:site-specific DNA recombinase